MTNSRDNDSKRRGRRPSRRSRPTPAKSPRLRSSSDEEMGTVDERSTPSEEEPLEELGSDEAVEFLDEDLLVEENTGQVEMGEIGATSPPVEDIDEDFSEEEWGFDEEPEEEPTAIRSAEGLKSSGAVQRMDLEDLEEMDGAAEDMSFLDRPTSEVDLRQEPDLMEENRRDPLRVAEGFNTQESWAATGEHEAAPAPETTMEHDLADAEEISPEEAEEILGQEVEGGDEPGGPVASEAPLTDDDVTPIPGTQEAPMEGTPTSVAEEQAPVAEAEEAPAAEAGEAPAAEAEEAPAAEAEEALAAEAGEAPAAEAGEALAAEAGEAPAAEAGEAPVAEAEEALAAEAEEAPAAEVGEAAAAEAEEVMEEVAADQAPAEEAPRRRGSQGLESLGELPPVGEGDANAPWMTDRSAFGEQAHRLALRKRWKALAVLTRQALAQATWEIGRASCRERVCVGV